MHAITVAEPGGPEVLVWGEVDDPRPAPGEILIDVAAAGVNRADLLQRQGNYPPPSGASPILGLECAGRVAALGDAVIGEWRIGDPCVALLAGGGYAERAAVPAGQVIPPPAGTDLPTAAGLMEVAATVVSNLDLAGLEPGRRLLVHGGSGGIGSFAIQYAKQLGVTVWTTAGTAEKLAYCRALGADHAIDYHDDWASKLADSSDGGVDVILDVIGAKYLDANLTALAPNGRLMIIGLQGGRKATIDLGAMLAKRAAVFATALRSRPTREKAAICRRVQEVVWPLVESGRIRAPRQTIFTLPRAAEAHALLESGENVGKIILTRAPN